jgi:peptidyl-prolyl cis-trans isomerase B (cyclophilin B)
MARSQNPNSASSQFFICYGDCTFLDGQYAAFGKVIEGMETVDNFLKIDRRMSFGGERSVPVEPIVMKTVEVL